MSESSTNKRENAPGRNPLLVTTLLCLAIIIIGGVSLVRQYRLTTRATRVMSTDARRAIVVENVAKTALQCYRCEKDIFLHLEHKSPGFMPYLLRKISPAIASQLHSGYTPPRL